MKKFSIFMIMALALVACNKEQNAVVEQPAEADQTPVSFGAYVNRSTTKSGFISPDLNIGILKDADPSKGCFGFGVFAFYTDADNYDQTYMPNFMYNQQVRWHEADINDNNNYWYYSPVKYWPNEFGRNAESDDADKISFFAYAPYVTVNPTSGKVNGNGGQTGSLLHPMDNGSVTEGIVGMKRNNATGDPMIQYKVSAYTNQQVDLVWGTQDSDDNTWQLKLGGGEPFEASVQNLRAGIPWLNIQHPYKTSTDYANAQKVAFNFKHALAKLNITVDTYTNSPNSAVNPATGTKVFIRSVTLEGFETKGALNLNNTTPHVALWYNFDCSNELNNGSEFTIYDGRKDGKEGITAATKEYAAINPTFVQDSVWTRTRAGVTSAAGNLFSGISANGPTVPGANEPILVIPNDDPLKVTIEYDVLTEDDNLAGLLNDGETNGSVVKNVITKEIKDGDNNPIKMVNGKVYTIKLHLGLNSVEFDATVTAWDPTPINGGADLPHNNQ